MLHDIKKVVLLAKLPDQYENAVELAVDHEILLRNAEKEIFNSLRGDIGAYLMVCFEELIEEWHKICLEVLQT